MALPRTGSLRLVDDEPRPEDLEPITVDVPSNEIAPGVTLEDGVMHVAHPDGSTTIDFNPRPEDDEEGENDFYDNLVNKIDSSECDKIAADLLDGIKRDITSREEWLETRAQGIKLLGLKLEEPRGGVATDSAPLEGMSTVRHPLLLDATINFQATARGELLPATGPVKVRNDTPPKSPSFDSAQSPPPPVGPMGGPGAPSLAPPAPPQGFQHGGAVRDIERHLTPQEMNLVHYHRNTIATGQTGRDEEGRPVTVYAGTIGIPSGPYAGKATTVPGYFDRKRHENDDELWNKWQQDINQGYWPIYDNPQQGDARAKHIHGIMDEESNWAEGYQQGGTVTPVTPAAPQGAPPPTAYGGPPGPQNQQGQPKPVTASENPLQNASPFATELAIPPSEEKDSLAAALETDFNHYLTVTAREYYPDTDRMLFYIGFGGDGFKKVYNCPLRRRPVSESVDAEDLIVSNSSTDLSNCGRITHRIKMRKSIVKRMQILGVYADVELMTPRPEQVDAVQEEKRGIEGVNIHAQKPEDQDYTIFECYCELDLDQFAPSEFKGRGLPLPYRVTIEETSRKILSIVRNWKEDDDQALPKQFFVQYPFIRGLGFYGLGFVHLLGNTTSTLTAMWREMTDSAMFGNFPGFLYAKWAGRQLTNQFRIPPGGGQAVDVMPGQRIQDAVMPLPYKEPGAGFTAFAQWVEQAGQRLGQNSQIAIGEGKQEVPVGTTLALIEQATKIINSAHKRLHAAQAEEFMLLKERFKEDPEAFWRGNRTPAIKWEKEQFLRALDDYNIVPVADPNNPTSLHRAAKAQIVEGLASKYPQIINLQAALKRVFRIAGIDTEGLLYDKPLPPPPDPRMVAIQQKAESTAQTVQAQTQAAQQKAVIQAMVSLKQLESKTSDQNSRNQIEQIRLMLEASEKQREMQGDIQKMHLERQQAADQRSADWAKTQQELGSNLVSKAVEGHTDALMTRMEGQKEAYKARQEHVHRQREHAWEMRRQQQEHDQRERDHEQKLRHTQELHAAELAQARALARTKKKSDTSKK